MDYKDLNDYELVYQVKENDEEAYNIIYEKYMHLIDILAKRYLRDNKNIGLDYDDLFQEGMYGLFRALDDYDEKSTVFYTYVLLCAKREMERLIKTCARNKHSTLNNSISINGSISDRSDLTYEDCITNGYLLDEEYEIEENYKRLMNFKYELDMIDSAIFELKTNSFTIKEISELLDMPYKKVDNRLHMIRKKMLDFI